MKKQYRIIYISLTLISLLASVSAVLIDWRFSLDNSIIWCFLLLIFTIAQSLMIYIKRRMEKR